jgi:tRNA-dihydrouridine synthase B
VAEAAQWLTAHLHDHYVLYGELSGVRSARKHIGWALRHLPGGEVFRAEMNRIDDCAAQVRALGDWFAQLGQQHERLPNGVASADAANDDLIELIA